MLSSFTLQQPNQSARRENPLLTAGTACSQPTNTPLFLVTAPNECDPNIYGGLASPSTTPKIAHVPCSPSTAEPWPPMPYTALQQQGQEQRGTRPQTPAGSCFFLSQPYFYNTSRMAALPGHRMVCRDQLEGDAAVFGWHRQLPSIPCRAAPTCPEGLPSGVLPPNPSTERSQKPGLHPVPFGSHRVFGIHLHPRASSGFHKALLPRSHLA